MKRLLRTGALLAAAALACTSCKFVGVKGSFCDHGDGVLVASDNLITKDIEVSDFKSLDVNLPCDVKFSVGEKSVSVYAADNLVEALAFEVDSCGRLCVSVPDYGSIRKARTVVLTISAPSLEGVTVNGASDIELEGKIVASEFYIDINGAGDVDADSIKASKVSVDVRGAGDIDIDNLDCESLSVSVNGAGDCTFAGRADNADIDVRGAGDVDITELRVLNLSKSVKGAGTVRTR